MRETIAMRGIRTDRVIVVVEEEVSPITTSPIEVSVSIRVRAMLERGISHIGRYVSDKIYTPYISYL